LGSKKTLPNRLKKTGKTMPNTETRNSQSVASRALVEFLRFNYAARDRLRKERLAAADHLGALQNQLANHQREAEAIATKAEAAQKKLEVAKRGVSEWQAVITKLEAQAVEYATAIDALREQGVTLPPAL
jgi:chromosome segregation ATPase